MNIDRCICTGITFAAALAKAKEEGWLLDDLKRELAGDIRGAEELRRKAAEEERQAQERLREIEAKRVELAEREAKVRVLEDQVKGLVRCDVCGGYFRGEHVCRTVVVWCGGCDGWFHTGHKCPPRK